VSTLEPARRGASRKRPAIASRDLIGGLTGGITSLPINLPTGIVAFAPLGAAAASNGAVSALFAVAVGAGLFAFLASTRGLHAGGSIAFSLVAAAALATLVGHGVVQPGTAGIPLALVVVALLSLLTALFQAALAASGLGRLVPLIPYPVLSGIRNATALLTVLVQYRALLGLSAAAQPLQWLHPGAAVAGATTLALMLFPIRRLPLVPPVLVAIAAGLVAHYGFGAWAESRGMGWLAGPVLPTPPSGPEQLGALAAGWSALPSLPLGAVLLVLAPAALSIALLSLMDTLAGSSIMQDRTGEHGSARGDLRALAIANVGAALFGGLPITGGVASSLVIWEAGGRSWVAGVVRAAVLFAGVMLCTPLLGKLPVAVVAGMVVGNAYRIFDREPVALARKALAGQLAHRAEMGFNLAVMALVPAIAVVFGMVPAVLTGTMLSLLLFAATMASGAVRRRYRCPIGLSRTQRSEQETAILLQHGSAIEVIELHGAVFFGSADQVAATVGAALESGARYVVLDFKRVSRIDLSGARRLVQVANRLWRSGAYLTLAAVQEGRPIWAYLSDLELVGQLKADRVFPTLEEALADAEDALLAAHGAAHAPASPEQALRDLGIPDPAVAPLLLHMQECRFEPGTKIITLGDGDDTVYVLLDGSADVILSGEQGGVRLARLTGARLFGEMALVSGAQRSAEIVARTKVRCLSLGADAYARLRRDAPDLACHLMTAIAAQAARNLRVANAALLSFEH
jgi:SulP family sulfate permease